MVVGSVAQRRKHSCHSARANDTWRVVGQRQQYAPTSTHTTTVTPPLHDFLQPATTLHQCTRHNHTPRSLHTTHPLRVRPLTLLVTPADINQRECMRHTHAAAPLSPPHHAPPHIPYLSQTAASRLRAVRDGPPTGWVAQERRGGGKKLWHRGTPTLGKNPCRTGQLAANVCMHTGYTKRQQARGVRAQRSAVVEEGASGMPLLTR